MTDYISRWDAINAVQEHFTEDGFCGYKDGQKMLDRINAIPSADVQEIKRGKWMYDDENTGLYAICSCCKESIYQAFEFYYCPICGAQMKEKT